MARLDDPSAQYINHDLPPIVPRKRSELLSSGKVSRRVLDRDWTTVARGRVIPPPRKDPASFGGFPASALDRARAQGQNHPGAIVGGWSACPFHGLGPDWADSAPTILFARRGHTGRSVTAAAVQTPLRPVIYPIPASGLPVIYPDPYLPDLAVVDAPTATAQCLGAVLDRRHGWPVLGIPQMSTELIRGVQLVDAFRHSTGVSCQDIRCAARHRVGADRITPVLELSDPGAESPMETILRLLALGCLPPGYRWESQLDLGRGQWGGTSPDLACRELRIALYYDGAHHDSPAVRTRDKAIDRQLETEGWRVLRFNRADLGVASVRQAIWGAVHDALEAQKAR